MAATNDTSLPERNKGWYQEDLTEVNEPIRKLLESYSKVPSREVVDHVNKVVSIKGQQGGIPTAAIRCMLSVPVASFEKDYNTK